MAIVVFFSLCLFTGIFPAFTYTFQTQFKYLIFPLLIWSSIKFRQRGTTLLIIFITGISIWGATHGGGPFIVLGNPGASLFYLGIFVAATSFTFMIFSVILEERDNVEKRFHSLIENSSDEIVVVTPNAKIIY